MTALLFAAAGLAGLALLFATAGLAAVAQAVAAAGWGGLALLVGWQLVLTVPLALAWRAVCPGADLRATYWARLVREAAGACLPFTAVGGMVIGARALGQRDRLGWVRAGASTAVDATLEFVAQVAFVVVGAVILLMRQPGSPLRGPLTAAILLAAAVAAGALATQGRVLGYLAPRIGLSRLGGDPARLGAEVDAIAGSSARLATGAAWHFLAWFGSGVAGWLAFRLLGHPIDLAAALAIEALLSFARACAFFVPAGLGVQEAVYVGLGGIYGVGAPLALAASLLRRGRELALGVPVLLAWQAGEWRRALPAGVTR